MLLVVSNTVARNVVFKRCRENHPACSRRKQTQQPLFARCLRRVLTQTLNWVKNPVSPTEQCTMSFSGAFVLFECRADKVQSKPQASVYDILPPTIAIPGYAMQYCKLTDSLRLCPHNSKFVTNRQLKLCQAPCFLLPLTVLTPAQTKRKSLELRQRQHSSGAV